MIKQKTIKDILEFFKALERRGVSTEICLRKSIELYEKWNDCNDYRKEKIRQFWQEEEDQSCDCCNFTRPHTKEECPERWKEKDQPCQQE